MMCCGSASREAALNASWNPRMGRSAGGGPIVATPTLPGEARGGGAGFAREGGGGGKGGGGWGCLDKEGGGVVAGMHVVNDDTVDAGAPEPLAEEDERC